MANRRMFSLDIIDSDAFMDMPLSTQALYFHLAMRADDDGFVNNPRKIQRMVNSPDDDLKLLIAKQFIIPFKSGIVVIRHWKLHNYIQADRYKPTVNRDEKALLVEAENKSYTLCASSDSPSRATAIHPETECIHPVSILETQVRLGKDRLGEVRLEQVSQEEDNTANSAEPVPGSTPPPPPAVASIISLPLIDGTEYGVSQSEIDKYSTLYPAVNILQELRNMVGWLEANPKRRKTPNGIKRFINNWLSSEQDRGGTLRGSSNHPGYTYSDDEKPYN